MPSDADPPFVSPAGVATTRYVEPREPVQFSTEPGDGSLPRDEANKDATVRRWDPATPSATMIGRPERPDEDVGDSLRRLHDEHHPAMSGHAERMHRLDKARIAHAMCNHLELTPWQRDRVLGILTELDLTAFGSQRAIPRVALVVIQHVVDGDRRRRLGLEDREWIASLDPDRMEILYDLFESITDDDRYRRLLSEHDMAVTNVNRLSRVLEEQLADQGLAGAALGRAPNRDPHLPAVVDDGLEPGPDGDVDR
jgi:hypothetical protein